MSIGTQFLRKFNNNKHKYWTWIILVLKTAIKLPLLQSVFLYCSILVIGELLG